MSKFIFINNSIYFPKEKVLIISDLHLGYEGELLKKGVLVPLTQKKEIIKNLKNILNKVNPKKIIINGDLKHEFGSINKQEWRDVIEVLDLLNSFEIVIIKGNHDKIIEPIIRKKNVEVVDLYKFSDTLIIHGDKIIKSDCKNIIIGHEHPAIVLSDKTKKEKYKCFLKGKFNEKELVVLPSFNPLIEGTNVLEQDLLSPYLLDIKDFEVYVNEMYFGKIKDLKKM